MDKDKGGTLTASEVRSTGSRRSQYGRRQHSCRPAGVCCMRRLLQVHELLGLLGMPLPRAEVAAMVDAVDADGSGAVDFEEFLQAGGSERSGGRCV